uniref:Uncharacterized protein n=1 Tax=Populus trichocarpa TaxID=3694 RepID=A0A3N7G4D7_POPTR|eukprot:XP_024443925.1 7-deoxyloganetin glucosyltransferase [Populus trichocarpa]
MTCKILADHKPHAVCLPSPYQSHIKSMLKLAKLLHHKGFHITFVNTEFNHKRLLKSRGPDSLKGLPDFRFESIPDGLPPSDENATQDLPGLCEAASKNLLAPFHDLLDKLNDTASPDVPPVTCIVSDGFMPVAITAAEMLGIPIELFITISACSFMGFKQFQALKEKGLTVKISTILMMPSVRRLAINIVTMLLVVLLQKENLLAFILCVKGRIFFV